MTDYYVNKSGNDSNGGTNHTSDARLTIASGLSLCTNGDTLYVGSGVYTEHSMNIDLRQGVIIEGDGYAIIDGAANNYLFSRINAPAWSDYFILRNLHLRNADIAIRNAYQTSRQRVDNCFLENIDYVHYLTGGHYGGYHVINTTVNGAINIIGGSTSSHAGLWCENCLFYNISGELSIANGTSAQAWMMKGNIVHTVSGTYGLWNGSRALLGGLGNFVDNYYYGFTGNFIKTNLGTYATLADFKVAYPGFEAGSYEGVDPQLTDPTNGILWPKDTSPTVGPGAVLPYRGPFQRVLNFSNAFNYSGTWTIATSPASSAGTQWARTSGTVNKVTDYFSGVGTIVSPVWDFGGVRRINRFMGKFSETYPTDVIDYDKTDIEPNRKNLQYRISDSAFNQDAISPSWVTHEIGETMSGVTGRYLQVELTFRADGVAA